MTNTEPLDLDAIEARANAASVLGALTRSITVTREDAVFIAHAREDVPALIAEVRRLRRERANDWEYWIDRRTSTQRTRSLHEAEDALARGYQVMRRHRQVIEGASRWENFTPEPKETR